MGVQVKLTWTNGSVAPSNQTVEVDLNDGSGFTTVTYVSPAAEHKPSVTPYEYIYDANLAASTTIKFRIVTTGVTGATVAGNEFSIEVPGNTDIVAVSDLSGTVEVI